MNIKRTESERKEYDLSPGLIFEKTGYIIILAVFVVIGLAFHSCKKPTRIVRLMTLVPEDTNITYNSALLYGEIVDMGSELITDHGIIVSETSTPIVGFAQGDPLGTPGSKGLFSSKILNLRAKTRYYYRAYATVKGINLYPEEETKYFWTKDSQLATLSANIVTDITMNSAALAVDITGDGGETISRKGICWDTIVNPSITRCIDSTINGSSTSPFTAKLHNLKSGKKYYVKAYATNGKGTGYYPSGTDISFTTHNLPTVTTTSVSAISLTGAKTGGDVTNEGGVSVTAKGVCWNTLSNPTTDLPTKTTDGVFGGSYVSILSGLTPGVAYFVRAFATNQYGTSYGNEISFTTHNLPTVTTNIVTNVTKADALSGGYISSDGGSSVTSRGVCWNTSPAPTITNFSTNNGTGAGSFLSYVSGLTPGTDYYLRAYATNQYGTSYGSERPFTTLNFPTLTTTDVTGITKTEALSGGNIISDGGSAITARGVCWNSSPAPTIANFVTDNGTGTGSFVSTIKGLTPGQKYYLRAWATSSAGTAYGNELSFTTKDFVLGSVNDYDGNTYVTVEIGTQVWMQENLSVTHYRNGDVIPNIVDNTGWDAQTNGAYCWYNNITAYKTIYGALYNYYATVDNRNLCPSGWHIPSDTEWTVLTDFLGGEAVAGGKLKETGTLHWLTPNTGATNESGFKALPGGYRYIGSFANSGVDGNWWSSTESTPLNSWMRYWGYNYYNVNRYSAEKRIGCSVRCIKD